MTLRIITTLLLLVTTLLVATALPAAAQSGPSVRAILDPRKISYGGQATLSIEVTGGSADSLPQRIQANGLSIDFMGHNSSVQIVNGTRTERFSYVYAVRPSSVGKFTIPTMNIRVKGKEFKTEAQELLVQEPSEAAKDFSTKSPYFLRLEVPRTELYVGEVVPLRLTLYVLGRSTISGVGQPEMEREGLVMKRFPTSPQSGATEIDGRIFSTLTLETSLFAITEGKMTIGPCSLPAMYYEAQEYSRTPTIFRRSVRKTFQSNVVELNIKPLPAAGRPDDFAGAVGTFQIAQNASPTDLESGDPISVDLEISGRGNFDSLDAPVMTGSEGWQLYPPRELVQSLSDGVLSGKVTYSQVIIPLEEPSAIPPFRFSYFDPEKEQFVTLETEPLPITVRPGREIASLGSSAETPGSSPGMDHPNALVPTENLEDILFIKTGTPEFRSTATPLLRSPGFWAAQSIPALAFLGFAFIGLRRGWVHWGATRQGAAAPPTCREIIAKMAAGQLSRREFYREAVECIDTWRDNETGSGRDTAPDLRREVAELEAAALGLVYGTPERGPDPPAPSPEADAVLKILRKLPANDASA